MIKKRVLYFVGFLVFAASAMSSAVAQTPTSAEPASLTKLPQLSANAGQTLFSLSYALQPVCNADHRAWSHGGAVYSVGKKSEVKGSKFMVAFLETRNQEVLFAEEKFGATTDQKLVLADQPLTPLGFSGLKKGDVFTFAEDSPPAETAGSPKTINPSDALKPPEVPNLNAALERRKLLKEKTDKKYFENPIQDLVVWKDGKSSAAKVRMVNICGLTISERESKYSYALAVKGRVTDGSVIVTAPFLESASPAELKSMLALESAYYALGYSGFVPSAGQIIAGSLFFSGALLTATTNAEIGRGPPPEKDLIESDKLALSLAQELGVTAKEYLDALKKFAASGSIFTTAYYSQTRPLGPIRGGELNAAIDRRNAAQPDLRAADMTDEVYASVVARLKSALANPAALFSVPAPAVSAKPQP